MSIQSLSSATAAEAVMPRTVAASASQSPAAQQSQPIHQAATAAQVQDAVAQVQKFVEPVAQNLQFSVDMESGKTVVRLIDVRSKEVLRQIPSEEMLAIARALGKLQGMLVNQKV